MLESMIRPEVQKLEVYIPGKPVEEVQREYGLDEIIKLASNENPFGVSPLALDALKKEIERVCEYPEGACPALRQKIAEQLHIHEDMVTVSNGADNVLMMVAQAFVEKGDEVVMAAPTFPIYKTVVTLMGGVPVEIPLKNHTHDLEAMAAATGEKTKAVFICNPNNPTGAIVSRDELDAFLEKVPDNVLVVLDEVYGDFTASGDFPDGVDYIRTERPIMSIRSFSKLYGLAGLRIGYGIGPLELIEALNRVREPFPVNRPAAAAALAALHDEAFREMVIRETEKGRVFLAEAFDRLGLDHLASHTNFIFVDLKTDAQEIFQALLKKGFIIRPGKTWGTPTCCRITVGTDEQNRKLVRALEEVLGRQAG